MNYVYIAIGDELIEGRVKETNSLLLAEELSSIGFKPCFEIIVGDDPQKLNSAFQFAKQASDIVIVSGGLGPTEDDLTTASFSEFANLKPVLYPELLKDIKAKFQKMGMKMPSTNKKQAILPEGAKPIHNRLGTAPGYYVELSGKHWFFFPGVPREFQEMVKGWLLGFLKSICKEKRTRETAVMKIFGLSESRISELISRLELPHELKISYRPVFPEIHLNITMEGKEEKELKKGFSSSLELIRHALGDYIYSESEKRLEEVVGEILLEKRLKLAVCESCTGGLLGKRITDIPGSSRYFVGGFIVYSNELKAKALGIDANLIETNGAVSSAVAIQMAKSAREKTSADIAVSITGIAGPEGGTKDKPVGTVHIAISDSNGVWEKQFNLLRASREMVRELAVETALDSLLRRLSGKRMPGE